MFLSQYRGVRYILPTFHSIFGEYFNSLRPLPSSSPRGKKYNIYDGRTILCPEPFIVRDLTGLEIIYAVNLLARLN